jgi:transposase
LVDTNGLPVHLALTPGEVHDNRLCLVLLSALLPQTMLLADRGYDADWIRELARQQGAWANIPPKRNRKDPICFSPYLYRARNLIERFFNKIKQCRRVATRYDKLAANYLAFVKLASIRIWLRANESTSYDAVLGDCDGRLTCAIAGADVRLACPFCQSMRDRCRKRSAPKNSFCKPLQADQPVQSCCEKYFAFVFSEIDVS